MELLSPAGSLETAAAAFQYGADAVYCGLHQFSARADAVNFSTEELEVLLGMARQDAARPRKVYLTLNTLLRQAELPEMLETLARLEELRPDGIIVQDLGLARLVKRHFPSLVLHASTQMAIHSLDGLRACRALGFRRIIAARELTLNEISAMAAEPDIEVEVFVHGALCYAYSGLCLLSSVLRGASGNRGECTYVCRNAWDIVDGRRTLARGCCVMSMKDLAQPDAIGALSRAGVASVKIEGRKKTPLYVAAVTNYYRKLLDNSFREGEREACEQDIRSIFSRPWTQLFLPGAHRFGVTDTAGTGPRGCRAGHVLAFTHATAARPPALRLVTEDITLERHDGLQAELPGRTRPYGFPVDTITLFRQGGGGRRESVFSVPPGSTIEIPLPNDAPELPAGTPLFCTSSQQTQRRYEWPSIRPALQRQRQRVTIAVSLTENALEGTMTLARDGAEPLTAAVTLPVEGAGLSPARKPPEENEAALHDALAKLGDTPYVADDIALTNPRNLFAPASQVNTLRRTLAERLAALQEEARHARMEAIAEECLPKTPSIVADAEPEWIVKIDRPHALNLLSEKQLSHLREVVFDLSQSRPEEILETLPELARRVGAKRLRLALPAILRDTDAGGAGRAKTWRPLVRELAAQGYRSWQVASLGAMQLLKEEGLVADAADLTADWPLYCNNLQAAQMLMEMGIKRVTLAPDDTIENTCLLAERLGEQAEVPVLQDTPLAFSAVCANASLKGNCPGPHQCAFRQFELSNRNGERLLVINNRCQSVYINKEYMDRRNDIAALRRSGARLLRTDFIWRDWSPAQIRDTLADLL